MSTLQAAELHVRIARFEAALDNMSCGVCFFDGRQNLLISNRRYAELYDLRPESLRPRNTGPAPS